MVLQIRTLLARETSRWMFLNTVPCSMFYIETIFMYFSLINSADFIIGWLFKRQWSTTSFPIKELRYWKPDHNDWLIVYCFLSCSRIFHSWKSHHFSHLLLRQWAPGFENIKQKKSWDIKHLPPLGWVVIITWSSHCKVSSKP